MAHDPAEVGARVLAALAEGRRKAHADAQERSAPLAGLVADLADADLLAGKPDRGRPGRVARKLRGLGVKVSRRHVQRILDKFSGMSDSTRPNSDVSMEEGSRNG